MGTRFTRRGCGTLYGVGNLLTAIENGAAAPALVQQLQTRQAEREALVKAISAGEAVTHVLFDASLLPTEALSQAAIWREWMDGRVQAQRQLLREVLAAPTITFTPGSGKSYVFDAPLSSERLLWGRCSLKVTSPTGFDDSCTLWAEGTIAA